MMDIAQRCREAACDCEWPCKVGDDAADEIERLRKDMVAAVETIKFVAKHHPMSASTRTRLTEIADEMTTAVQPEAAAK